MGCRLMKFKVDFMKLERWHLNVFHSITVSAENEEQAIEKAIAQNDVYFDGVRANELC